MYIKNILLSIWIFCFLLLNNPIKAATFTVTNNADAGVGSLRQAILDAEATAGADVIEFNISGGGLQTIQLQSALPIINETLIIDGTTQTGFTANPIIEINGAALANGDLLSFDGVINAVVKSLIINGGPANGIFMDGCNGGMIDNCFIGTNSAGTASVGNGADGIRFFQTVNVTIQNCVLAGNTENGIGLQVGTSHNIILGCKIGTDLTGTTSLGNTESGIELNNGCNNNVIGGANTNEGNVISGNTLNGITIAFGSNGNEVLGNIIGLQSDGNTPLGNDGGGVLIQESLTNTIGGTNAGEGNTISGNAVTGITIIQNSANNQVFGNQIGVNTAGDTGRGNGSSGILIDESDNNQIGSSVTGGSNTISGNVTDGITLQTGGTGNIIQNNIIGLDKTGTTIIKNDRLGIIINEPITNTLIGGDNPNEGNVISGNGLPGIDIRGDFNTMKGNIVGLMKNGVDIAGNGVLGVILLFGKNNVIGSSNPNGRNIISGNNGDGIRIQITTNNTLIGNFIGTDITGTLDKGNTGDGILLFGSNSGHTIGGDTAGAGNLISGNDGDGIFLFEGNNITISGNLIGTDVHGTALIPNGSAGARLNGVTNGNVVGGTTVNERNIICGNPQSGIFLQSTAQNYKVIGNFIGTNINGDVALPNGFSGISMNNSNENIIGGGNTGEGNLISGNTSHGIHMTGTCNNNIIQGNKIGTNFNGNAAIPNGGSGIEMSPSSSGNNNKIGGSIAEEGNLISGNDEAGINIRPSAHTNNIIQGNLVGLDATGTVALPNTFTGIIANGLNTQIGGTNAGEGNISSGNGSTGIAVTGAGSIVQGNIVGLNQIGTAAIPNDGVGVRIEADNIQIGGTATGARNIISGNIEDGIAYDGGANVKIEGNFIGTNKNGDAAIGNEVSGISIFVDPINLTIGGTAMGAGNVISGNDESGIDVFESDGAGSKIIGNFIGTNLNSTLDLGNANQGILFFAASNFEVGGNTIDSENTIAFNGTGILLAPDPFFGSSNEDILIDQNSIFNNDVKGISIAAPHPVPAVPTLNIVSTGGVTTNIQGNLNGNANTNYILNFFKNISANPAGNHEGKTFLGSTNILTDGTGIANINVTIAATVNIGEFVTATARATNENTSEFSNGIAATALPVELISFIARPLATLIRLDWETASEQNNEGFFIERRTEDQTDWIVLAFEEGQGTTTVFQSYSFEDRSVEAGTNYYYRLRQIDFNGQIDYSRTVQAALDLNSIQVSEIYPNPASSLAILDISNTDLEGIQIEIHNISGQFYSAITSLELIDNTKIRLPISNLNPGEYIVTIRINHQLFERRLIVLGS